jgi:hypothetical protein
MRLLPLFVFGIGIATFPAFASAQLVSLDFETSGQLGANFNAALSLNASFASEQSSGGNGYVAATSPAAGSAAWIGVYDPADPSNVIPTFSGPITISLDISSESANASFGVFLFDTADAGNNLLALYNLDFSGANEQIRFWHDTPLNSTNVVAANQYLSGSINGTNGTFSGNAWITNAGSAGATVSTTSPYTFYRLTFAYDPTARTLRLASDTFSATLNIPAGDVINNPGFALRVNDPSAGGSPALTAKIDNLTVVPEPGTAAMLALAGLVFGLRRRR